MEQMNLSFSSIPGTSTCDYIGYESREKVSVSSIDLRLNCFFLNFQNPLMFTTTYLRLGGLC